MRSIFLFLILALMVTACAPISPSVAPIVGANVEVIEASVTSTTTVPTPGDMGFISTPTIPPPPTTAPGVNPLTGLIVPDATVLERRPMIVKISNAPALVRPQAGLGAADIVYEHYAEGGLTRFSAIFYSQAPERVGSIRSARLIDNQLMPMYGGILAYSGTSVGVGQILGGSDFADRLYLGVAYGSPYFWRDQSQVAPHNLFMSTAALWTLATEEGINTRPNLDGMTFDEDVPSDSNGAANSIDIRYTATRVLWEYDSTTGLYRRTSDGSPHRDATTGQQVTAANVVVIYATHTFTDIVESEWQGSVSYSIEINLIGEGSATLFRDGQRYDCHWVRNARDDRLTLVTLDGEPLPFRPGNTWFQLVRPPEQMNTASEWVQVE